MPAAATTGGTTRPADSLGQPLPPLPRVRGLAALVASMRSLVASWSSLPGGGDGRNDPSSGRGGDAGGGGHTGSGGDSPTSLGGFPDGRPAGEALSVPAGPMPLTPAMVAAMPEYALLGRCSRARAWLADVWDPAAAAEAAAPCPVPPLNPAALAGAVALDRVVRFPAADALPTVPGGPLEDPDTYLPPDEADGTGLGPVLADITVMIVPVEAPPLRRSWTAVSGGGMVPPREDHAGAFSAAVDASMEAVDGAYDEDDEVVTGHVIADVQRDCIGVATGGLFSVQPVSRGVLHRRTGETLSVTSMTPPPGLLASRVLLMEYCAPRANGCAVSYQTSLAVGERGSLTLLSRVDAMLQPSIPRPTLVFPPVDGITATAHFSRDIQGAFGVAFVPCVPGLTPVTPTVGGPNIGSGGFPAPLPLIMQCTEASAATTARMRRRAVAALLPPSPPLLLPRAAVDPATTPRTAAAATAAVANATIAAGTAKQAQAGSRRPRRVRRDLDSIESEAQRRRIVRNRASAARSNAARRRERLAARSRDGDAAAARGGLLPPVAPPACLPVLLPRL
ncbi:hypothetical protein MMPV_003315 [Pyropia vietnamensis]